MADKNLEIIQCVWVADIFQCCSKLKGMEKKYGRGRKVIKA
jgi:hypothetical protein